MRASTVGAESGSGNESDSPGAEPTKMAGDLKTGTPVLDADKVVAGSFGIRKNAAVKQHNGDTGVIESARDPAVE